MIEIILAGVFSAIGTGGLIRWYDIYVKKGETFKGIEQKLRDELRADIDNLRGYVTRLENELRESRQEALLLNAKNAELEYRATIYEKQANDYKIKADKNEIEVERLKRIIERLNEKS